MEKSAETSGARCYTKSCEHLEEIVSAVDAQVKYIFLGFMWVQTADVYGLYPWFSTLGKHGFYLGIKRLLRLP